MRRQLVEPQCGFSRQMVALLRTNGLYASMWYRQREATEAEERLRQARETDELGVIVRRRTEQA